MWLLLLFLCIFSLPCIVQTLEPFDPWAVVDGTCAASMETCSFELRANNAMTMFYNQLFRVVATSNGVLQKYDDSNQTFAPVDILTGDGYPKLVRNIYLYLVKNHIRNDVLCFIGVCVQQFSSWSCTARLPRTKDICVY